jgi:antitoxin PrlF
MLNAENIMKPCIDLVRNNPYNAGIAIRRAAMPAIHEVATLTSKGQITLPKSIRQALGADTGSKLAFELRGGEVVVTRADAEHEDPAIAAFLALLARDIEAGRNVRGLPEDLARTMLEHAGHKVDLGDDFGEDVEI